MFIKIGKQRVNTRCIESYEIKTQLGTKVKNIEFHLIGGSVLFIQGLEEKEADRLLIEYDRLLDPKEIRNVSRINKQ